MKKDFTLKSEMIDVPCWGKKNEFNITEKITQGILIAIYHYIFTFTFHNFQFY